MGAERKVRDAEPLLEVSVEERTEGTPEAVYDLLVDLGAHLEWGGRRQKKGFRLTSIDAPEGAATVGTEFRTTGIDPGGRFADSSVVTEATRPSVFEFVTTARQQPKRGEANTWTNVSRYEITPAGRGCMVRYSMRVMQLSRKVWWTGGIGGPLARSIAGRNVRVGVRNLARMAEERTGGAGRAA